MTELQRQPMPIPRLRVPSIATPAPRALFATATPAPPARTVSPLRSDGSISVRERINQYELNQNRSTIDARNSTTSATSAASQTSSNRRSFESRPRLAERRSVLSRIPWLETTGSSTSGGSGCGSSLQKTTSHSNRPTMRLIRDMSAVYRQESALSATAQRTEMTKSISQVISASAPLIPKKSHEHLEFRPLRKRVEDLMMHLDSRPKAHIPISMNITLNCL